MPGQLDLIPLLHSNHLVVKPSLEVSDLERWKFGLSKLWCCQYSAGNSYVKSDDVVGRAKAYEAIVKENPCLLLVFLNH
jgi:hypothetical protein